MISTIKEQNDSGVIPTIFILSWNRPIYLWACLDSLYRHTKHSCKIILADNNSSDPIVHQVIEGFEKRGLFDTVLRCKHNDPFRFKKMIEEYWDEIDQYFVLIESDIEILPTTDCWLGTFMGYMLNDTSIGSIGSRVYQDDFVSMSKAQQILPKYSDCELSQLIKSHAPMRNYQHTAEPLICPHNPPLRLLILRKSAYEKISFGRDTEIHARMIEQGYKSLISTEIVHRHLSLLNIYDYSDFSSGDRDTFFDQQLNS